MPNTKDTLILEGDFHVSVYYEDTDFTGYVYHANYLKFFERAREELIGFKTLRALYKQEQHFVIKSLSMDFKRPAHHSDKLLIKTKAELTSSPKSLFRQEAWLIKGDEETLLVSADLFLVFVGPTGRPIRMDLEAFKSLLEKK